MFNYVPCLVILIFVAPTMAEGILGIPLKVEQEDIHGKYRLSISTDNEKFFEVKFFRKNKKVGVCIYNVKEFKYDKNERFSHFNFFLLKKSCDYYVKGHKSKIEFVDEGHLTVFLSKRENPSVFLVQNHGKYNGKVVNFDLKKLKKLFVKEL